MTVHTNKLANASFSVQQASERLNAALARAIEEAGDKQPAGMLYAGWAFERIDRRRADVVANVALVGRPPRMPFEFTVLHLEDFVCWLDDASWLDELAISYRRQHYDSLIGLCRKVGDLGIPGLNTDLGPGRTDLPSVVAYLGFARRYWLAAVALHRGRLSDVREVLREDLRGQPPETDVIAFARERSVRLLFQLGLEPLPPRDAQPPRYEFGGPRQTPIQALSVALAAALGAIEGSIPHIYACSYRPCGRPFVAARPRKGQFQFCSPGCGKSFYAMKSTYERRNAARQAKRKQQED